MKNRKTVLRFILLIFTGSFIYGSSLAYAESSWVPIGPEGGRIVSIIQHPTQAQVLYLIAGDINSSLYQSPNKGNTWTKLAAFNRTIFCLIQNPKNPKELFAGAFGQFFRSTDGGAVWTSASFSKYIFRKLSPDFLNGNILHACGASNATDSNQYVLSYFKSTDKGVSWTVKPATTDISYGQALCVDPKNSNVVFIGGYGSGEKASSTLLYKTTDGGNSWIDVSGSMAGSINDILMDSTDVKRVFAANGTGVSRSTDMGGTWSPNNGWIYGIALAQDPKNKNTLYLGGTNVSYRSTDGGVNWSACSNGIADSRPVNSMLVDGDVSSTVYLGSESGFYKSTDSGHNWAGSNSGIFSANITLVASPPSNPSVLYAARQSDYVFKTQNALGKPVSLQSVAWEKFYKIPNCDSYSIKSILFHPAQPNTFYVYKEYG